MFLTREKFTGERKRGERVDTCCPKKSENFET